MARPTEMGRYPPQFFELIERFEQESWKPILIPVSAEGEVSPKALQLELQAFRSALRKAGALVKYPSFERADIRIAKDRRSVTISRKDKTPSALAVQKALDNINKEDQGAPTERKD